MRWKIMELFVMLVLPISSQSIDPIVLLDTKTRPVWIKPTDLTEFASLSDDRRNLIGSSNGRSYRGQKSNGFGVQDLYVPAAESSSRLVGYGTPHGIGVE